MGMETGNIIDLAKERRRRGPRFDGGLMDILEVSRDLVCLCRGGAIAAINGAGARLLGAPTTEQLLGRKLTDFLIPEYASVMSLFLAGKASEDKAVPTRLLALDGAARDVEMQVYRAREIAPDATVIVCRDVTDHSRLVDYAHETDARFSLLVENAMNMVCHVVDGRLRYVNRAGLAMLGAPTREAVSGRALAEIFHEDYAEVFTPDTLAFLVAESTGVPMRLRRLDGAPVDVLVMVSPLPSHCGVEMMVEARDITAHNRAVVALRSANETLEMRVVQRTRELAEQRRLAEENKSIADASRRFTESLLDMIPGPVWFKDARGRFQTCNRAFRDLFGGDPTRRAEGADGIVMSEEDRHSDAEILGGTIDQVVFEADVPTAGGDVHHLMVSKCAYRDDEGRPVGILGVITDITERKALERELRRLATTDPLTGAANRRQFMHSAATELERALRYGHDLSVIMLDIDHFKRINDTHGHAVGDEALKALVATIQAALREMDVLGRLGGEEFSVLLPETGLPGAVEVAERLRAAIAAIRLPVPGDGLLSFTSSLGVAARDGHGRDIEELLARADQALYRAKQGGRDLVETG
ncbi:MAG: sensor domain-containing diguanylate cyclase [Pseudomonadota bacterium]